MDTPKLLDLTMHNRLYSAYNEISKENERLFNTLAGDTLSLENSHHDREIINNAKKIDEFWKHTFKDVDKDCNGYAYGLYMTYNEINKDNSRFNKTLRSYVNNKFKNESEFRIYYLCHKDAPQSHINKKF